MYLQISATVTNGFDFPKQLAALNVELAELTEHIEESTDYEPEDLILDEAFSVGAMVNDQDRVKEIFCKLSKSYPELMFAVDYNDAHESKDAPLFRVYFNDGESQEVLPFTVIPDPDLEGEWK